MFKVRCKVISFEGDPVNFPCHFGYEIGDEIMYDGVNFTGRICPGLFATMMPFVLNTYLTGNAFPGSIMYRYRGVEALDPAMAKYDGQGLRPLKLEDLAGDAPERMKNTIINKPTTERVRGLRFVCADTRTLVQFACEAVDLSDSAYAQPFYRRLIAILKKIEAEPGIQVRDIINRFTDFERDNIAPALSPVLMELFLNALADMKYITVTDGKVTATGKEPPSRPKIGDE